MPSSITATQFRRVLVEKSDHDQVDISIIRLIKCHENKPDRYLVAPKGEVMFLVVFICLYTQ